MAVGLVCNIATHLLVFLLVWTYPLASIPQTAVRHHIRNRLQDLNFTTNCNKPCNPPQTQHPRAGYFSVKLTGPVKYIPALLDPRPPHTGSALVSHS